MLQRNAGYLGRIQDAHGNHVAILTRAGVVTIVTVLGADLIQHNRSFLTSVGHDLTQRLFNCLLDNFHTHVLVSIGSLDAAQCIHTSHQSHAATRNNTFLHGCAGRVQCIFNAGLFLFHLDFS